MLRTLLFLAIGAAPVLCAAQSNVGPDGAPPLYGCIDNAGKQRFSGAAIEGCVPAKSLSADWHWLGLREKGTQATYVDLRHVAHRDGAVGVWVMTMPPDSSGAVLGGPETFHQFDFKTHAFFDCATHESWMDEVQLIRNARSTPQVVKDVLRDKVVREAIKDDSVMQQVEALVCDGGRVRATLP